MVDRIDEMGVLEAGEHAGELAIRVFLDQVLVNSDEALDSTVELKQIREEME
jgi:hypothetical protein